MQTITFGKYEKHGFTRSENFSQNTYSQKIEKNIQQTTFEDGTEWNATTLRLIYNFGFPVTETLLDSLLPTTDLWSAERNSPGEHNSIDAAFNILNGNFSNFTFGKSMQAWFEGVPGFSACLAFNTECTTGTTIETAIKEHLLKLRLIINDENFRLVPQDVGYYIGPKGHKKKVDRTSGTVFAFSDPLSADIRSTFKNELNLDFKFALAPEKSDGLSATIPTRHFYHGEHPLISVSFNLHLQPASTGETPLAHWGDIENGIVDEITPFIRFLERCVKFKNITDPYKTKGFSGWNKTNPAVLRMQTPSHPLFVSRQINTDPMNTEQDIAGLPEVTRIYPEPEATVEVTNTNFGTTNIARKGNFFALLDDESDEENDSENDDIVTHTLHK